MNTLLSIAICICHYTGGINEIKNLKTFHGNAISVQCVDSNFTLMDTETGISFISTRNKDIYTRCVKEQISWCED